MSAVLGKRKERDDEKIDVSADKKDEVESKEEKKSIPFVYGSLARHSHTIVAAKCTAKASPKCKGEVTTRYAGIMDTCDNHDGNYVCLPCARTSVVKKKKNESLREEKVEEFKLGKYDRSSHHRVRAYCELKVSDQCTQQYVGEYRHVVDVCERNEDKYVCLYCSRTEKFTGRSNPNCKHKFDDNFMENIDTEFKAYLLGWIASDGHLRENGCIIIMIHNRDRLLLKQLRDGVCKTIEIKEVEEDRVSLVICSTIMNAHVVKWLGLHFEKGESRKKSSTVRFPELSTPELKWYFLRGYFDGDGCICLHKSGERKEKVPRSDIASNSIEMLKSIKEFVNLPCYLSKDRIAWAGCASLILWQKMYANATIYLHRKHQLYLDNKNWRPEKKTAKVKKLLQLLDELTTTSTSSSSSTTV